MTKNLTDNLMKLTTLGASREVGRSAFLLEIEKITYFTYSPA